MHAKLPFLCSLDWVLRGCFLAAGIEPDIKFDAGYGAWRQILFSARVIHRQHNPHQTLKAPKKLNMAVGFPASSLGECSLLVSSIGPRLPFHCPVLRPHGSLRVSAWLTLAVPSLDVQG